MEENLQLVINCKDGTGETIKRMTGDMFLDSLMYAEAVAYVLDNNILISYLNQNMLEA